MSSELEKLPCGLYRTTLPLPGKDAQVPAGCLVKFHSHSKQGPPIILLPQSNRFNRWTFFERGFLVEDETYLTTLHPLTPEGLYTLTHHVHLGTSEVIAEKTLVQLGYNKDGVGIIFCSEFLGNTIQFPDTGYKISDEILEILQPVNFTAPKPRDFDELH